jgi:hypothetical protein
MLILDKVLNMESECVCGRNAFEFKSSNFAHGDDAIGEGLLMAPSSPPTGKKILCHNLSKKAKETEFFLLIGS